MAVLSTDLANENKMKYFALLVVMTHVREDLSDLK